MESVIGPTGAPKDFSCLARSPSDKAVTSKGRPPFTLLLMTIFCGGFAGCFYKIKIINQNFKQNECFAMTQG